MRKKNNAFLYLLDLYKLCKQINNSVHNKKTLMQNTGICAYVKFVGFANFVQTFLWFYTKQKDISKENITFLCLLIV